MGPNETPNLPPGLTTCIDLKKKNSLKSNNLNDAVPICCKSHPSPRPGVAVTLEMSHTGRWEVFAWRLCVSTGATPDAIPKAILPPVQSSGFQICTHWALKGAHSCQASTGQSKALSLETTFHKNLSWKCTFICLFPSRLAPPADLSPGNGIGNILLSPECAQKSSKTEGST